MRAHMLIGKSAKGLLRDLRFAVPSRIVLFIQGFPHLKCRRSGLTDQSLGRDGMRALLGDASVVQWGDAQRLLEEPVAPEGMKVGLVLSQ